jgi:hypothetical protein
MVPVRLNLEEITFPMMSMRGKFLIGPGLRNGVVVVVASVFSLIERGWYATLQAEDDLGKRFFDFSPRNVFRNGCYVDVDDDGTLTIDVRIQGQVQ